MVARLIPRHPIIRLAIAAIALALVPPPASAQPTALTIDVAIERALAVSEDTRAAEARRQQAAAQLSGVKSAFLPSVTLNGSYTRRKVDTGTMQGANVLGANVTAAMTLFDGRNYPLLRAARRRLDAAGLDEQEQRRQVAYGAAAAYLVALGQEGVVEAAVRRQELATARQQDAAARVDAKLVSTNDRTQANLELATATRELAGARAALAVAYQELAWWIGGEVTGPLVTPAPLHARAGDGDTPAAIDAQRPDLAAARLRVDVARETAREPGRRLWPTLDLTGQYRWTNEAGLSRNDTDWLVTLGATWVLWDGGRRSADRRVAELDVELARLDVLAAERRAGSELATAAVQLRGARAALPPAEQVAAAAGANADEVAVLYAQGLARALDVADAGAKRFEAEVALVQARLDVAAAWLALTFAAGSGPLAEGSKP